MSIVFKTPSKNNKLSHLRNKSNHSDCAGKDKL